MPTEEQLKLEARVTTDTVQLDTLIGKLKAAEQVANRLDDTTIDIEVNDGEVDALIAKLSALEGGDLFSGDTLLGDINADIFDDIDVSDLNTDLDGPITEVVDQGEFTVTQEQRDRPASAAAARAAESDSDGGGGTDTGDASGRLITAADIIDPIRPSQVLDEEDIQTSVLDTGDEDDIISRSFGTRLNSAFEARISGDFLDPENVDDIATSLTGRNVADAFSGSSVIGAHPDNVAAFDLNEVEESGEALSTVLDDDLGLDKTFISNNAENPNVERRVRRTLDSDEVDKRVEGLLRGARDEFNPLLKPNLPDMREAIDAEELVKQDRRRNRGVAGAARDALSRFTELSQTRVGLTKFYDVLAIFVPTLLAFQATMPLVIGGLYSLAAAALASTAALGAIGGLGLLGAAQNEAGGGMPSQEDFSAVFDGVGEEFVEAFRPVTERLAPLFEDAVDALGPLFDRLAGVSEQLLDLKGPVRDLGGFVADNLVEGLNSTLAFASAAVPLFRTIGDAVEDINLARAFAGVLADAIPTLAAFSSIIVQSLPGILEFARGMSLVTRSVLFLTSELVGLLDPLLELIPGIDSGVAALGTLAGIILTASTATLLYGKVLALATSSQLAFVAAKLKSLAAYAGTIVMSKLAAAGVSFFGAAAAGAAAGVLTLATAVGLLTGGLSILAGALAGLGAGFTSMGSDVSDATDELEAFSQQRDSMVGRNTAMMGDLDRDVYVNVTQDNSVNVEGNADESSMATLSAESDTSSFKPGELPPGVYNA